MGSATASQGGACNASRKGDVQGQIALFSGLSDPLGDIFTNTLFCPAVLRGERDDGVSFN